MSASNPLEDRSQPELAKATNEQPEVEPQPPTPLAPLDPPSDPDDEQTEAAPTSQRRFSPLMIGSTILALVAIGVAVGVAAVPPPVPVAPTPTLSSVISQVDPAAAALPQASSAIDPATVIVRVGARELTHADFTETYIPGEDPAQTIEQMIDVELVVQASLEEGVEIDPERIEAQIAEIRASQTGGTDAEFDSFLRQNNIASLDELREILERQQLIEAAMMNHTLAEQARARHILLATGDETDSTTRQAEAEAILAELEGGADFAALAAERSEDPGSSGNGGDLGWTPKGLFVEAFEQAIFSMEPGEIRLVESPFGWHIIELLEGPDLRPLSDPVIVQQWMRSPLGQEAFNQTFLPWIDGLREAAQADGNIEILVDTATLITVPSS